MGKLRIYTRRMNVVTIKGRPYDPGARTCAVLGCGNTFTAVRSTARYCSDRCRLTAARLRRRKGLTVLPLELPTAAVEGIIAALEHSGLSEADASDLRRIAAEIMRHVVHWAAHWRELRR